MSNYRASQYAKRGTWNEHSYNLYARAVYVMYDLRLWKTNIEWFKIAAAFSRLRNRNEKYDPQKC